MHYRNGREAKNGDKIVNIEGEEVASFGVLHSPVPGDDFCDGNMAAILAGGGEVTANQIGRWLFDDVA